MKRPENYNAGATVRKPNPLEEAISHNFSTEKETAAPKPTPVQQFTSTNTENVPKTDEKSASPSKREVKEKFLVSMSKGERSIFKAFCAMQNVSMNHFVMCAMDYFKEDLENGKVTISPHSYKRQG